MEPKARNWRKRGRWQAIFRLKQPVLTNHWYRRKWKPFKEDLSLVKARLLPHQMCQYTRISIISLVYISLQNFTGKFRFETFSVSQYLDTRRGTLWFYMCFFLLFYVFLYLNMMPCSAIILHVSSNIYVCKYTYNTYRIYLYISFLFIQGKHQENIYQDLIKQEKFPSPNFFATWLNWKWRK